MALRRNLPVVLLCTTLGVHGLRCVDSALVFGCLAAVDDVVGAPVVIKRLMRLIYPLPGLSLGHEIADRLGLTLQLTLVVVEFLH